MRVTTKLLLPALLVAAAIPARAQLRAAEPAPGVFLVAKPEMSDLRFEHAVILLITHDGGGTSGLVLTQPSGMALTRTGETRHLVYNGGPVAPNQVQMLVRGAPPDSSFQRVWEDVWWSRDQELIEALIEENSIPEVFRMFVGYAGWVPGQLDTELATFDSWDLFRAEPDDVFLSDPIDLWDRFMGRNRRLVAARRSR